MVWALALFSFAKWEGECGVVAKLALFSAWLSRPEGARCWRVLVGSCETWIADPEIGPSIYPCPSAGDLCGRNITRLPRDRRRAMVRDRQADAARHAADDAIQVVTRAMRAVVEPRMVELLGADWPSEFCDASGRPLRREDFLGYVRGLDVGPNRDALRGCFSAAYRYWERALHRVRNHRNRTLIHADQPLTTEDARTVVADCVRLAKDALLECNEDLQEILGDLARGAGVTAPHPGELEDLRRRVDEQDMEIAKRDSLMAEAEIAVAEAEDRCQVIAAERDEARSTASALDRKIEALEAKLSQRSARSHTETQELADRLRNLQSQRDAALEDSRRQSRLLRDANRRQREVEREAESARAAEEVARGQADRLAVELNARQAVARSSRSAEPPDSAATDLQSLIQRLEGVISNRSSVDRGLPPPGEPWPYPRGRDVWRLSKQQRSLTRVADDADVSALVGATSAAGFVDRFLAIRPTGGRVWVGAYGDASTIVNGRSVFLGRLEQSPNQSPTADGPLIGTPIENPRGRRYALGRQGITCKGTDQDLKDVVGVQRAKEVRDRLLAVKPKGGALRVAADGTAAVYIGGQWVYAGRIAPAEWFPGRLEAHASSHRRARWGLAGVPAVASRLESDKVGQQEGTDPQDHRHRADDRESIESVFRVCTTRCT